MRRLALAMCAGALGITLVACGGGAPATSEPAATQEVSEGTADATEEVADDSEIAAETDEDELPELKKSMLLPFVESFNAKDGMHITYTVRMTFMNEDGSEDHVENYAFDTHMKGKDLFQRRTSLDDPNSIMNGTTAIWNGDQISLDEEAHTGKILMHDALSAYAGDENAILLQTDPYRIINYHKYDYDFEVEEREVDGSTYTVERHPQVGDYEPQIDFYFDKDGSVAYIQQYRTGPDDIDPEYYFTIEAWDKNVDESLLDLSSYELKELL